MRFLAYPTRSVELRLLGFGPDQPVIILERHQGVPWCYVQLDRIVTRLLFIPSYLGAAGLSIFFSCPVGADGDCISAHVPDWAVHGLMAL